MPCSLTVRSDRRLLRRLLQNLVSNAIKYTLQGRVLVGCRRRRGRLRVEVYDTGLGIPNSKKRLIFREFHRLDEGAKVARGLGLGLSIVQRIARVLDHKIDLRSVTGRGSRFSVEVPLSSAVPSEPAVAAAGQRRSRAARSASPCFASTTNPRCWTAWTRCSAAGVVGCCEAPDLTTAVAAVAESQVRTQRPSDRLSSRQGQRHRGDRRIAPALRRRVAGDPDHRRPLAACARRGARARRTGAEQAAQARGAARADGAMAAVAARGAAE